MRVVVVKHSASRKNYLYEVPTGAYLQKGDEVIVHNANGETSGVCQTEDLYVGDDALTVFRALIGADPDAPLAKVVGKISVTRYD